MNSVTLAAAEDAADSFIPDVEEEAVPEAEEPRASPVANPATTASQLLSLITNSRALAVDVTSGMRLQCNPFIVANRANWV